MLSNKYKDILETIRVKLSPRYSHTQCMICRHVVGVDPNGNVVEHGPGEQPCAGSLRNDEDVADELDRGRTPEPLVEPLDTDGEATH